MHLNAGTYLRDAFCVDSAKDLQQLARKRIRRRRGLHRLHKPLHIAAGLVHQHPKRAHQV